jgi:hypothetical protein
VGGEDAGDDIDGATVTAVEVERGRVPEMAPPGGEDLGAGGILGGESRDDLTQNGVAEDADSVDPISFLSAGSRRRILDVAFVSFCSRMIGITLTRRTLQFWALGCLRLPSLGRARRHLRLHSRRQVG